MAEEPPGDQKPETDHLEPWFESDGNIVLEAQGKYFRVHRSVLSSHSEVFKSMFDCSQPSEGEQELIEQCPVVHLHYDAATDVQMVLKAMYDRSYPVPYYEEAPLPIVAAFLRLGEKYAIQQLFDEAKARLSCASEPTLSVAARITSASHKWTLKLFQGVTNTDPHNFQIMNLLHEMDLTARLPLAMYQCAVTCPLDSVLDGYTFEGTVYTLSPANLRSLIRVKSTLENFRIRLAKSLRVSNSCVVQSSCACSIHRVWSDEVTVAQPLSPWKQEWDKLFCDSCRSELNGTRNAAIQQTWNKICGIFGVEPLPRVGAFFDLLR